ncbi:MAG: DUF3566 domain-containing protein [Frankiaceae bacterium]|nr:DUF3566 domain-containing protein [Frankiaceae bacterium]MBV9870371.1 DUF3566 domain-containing protein [Frankiaceae bacterium]
MTTGSGDMLGGAPRFGDSIAPSTRGSTVEPETSRPKPVLPPPGAAATVVPEDKKRPVTVGTAPVSRKKGRRARLTVKRIDPWTTLKFSFVYGLAGMVVLLVSVIVLYGVVDAMGVISSVRSFLSDVGDSSSSGGGGGIGAWLGFSRVMLVTLVLGLVNVVLFTAFATLTAFIYNVCTDIVGGVEVTLAERN